MSEIMSALNALRLSHGRPGVDATTPLRAAWESDVDFSQSVPSIRKDRTWPLHTFETELLRAIQGGPSWIHANLVPTESGDWLITFRLGADIQHPTPPINTSFEATPYHVHD